MKATGPKITLEAVQNFCALTGCKFVYRGGGRPRAKHWQISDSKGRRLFFVKATSSMRRFMELYEKSQQPVLRSLNFWGSSHGQWSGKTSAAIQNLNRQMYQYGKSLWHRPGALVIHPQKPSSFAEVEARVHAANQWINGAMRRVIDEYSTHTIDALVYANLANKAAIHERIANASPVPASDRRELCRYDSGHGVPSVRAEQLDPDRQRDGASLGCPDQHGADGADVAPSDPESLTEETEDSWVEMVLPRPHRGEPVLSQAVQNLLELNNLTARIRILEQPGARSYMWVVYSLSTAKKPGEITAAADLASWIKFVLQMEKISGWEK